MARRIPFTFNAMVLLPLLRSLPTSSGVAVVATGLSMTGLDGGALRLGHPNTAADDLVALMMAFSIATPVFWALYATVNACVWGAGFVGDLRRRFGSARVAAPKPLPGVEPPVSRDGGPSGVSISSLRAQSSPTPPD